MCTYYLTTHPLSRFLTTTILRGHNPHHRALRRPHWPPPSSLFLQICSDLELITPTTCSSPSRRWCCCPFFFFRSDPLKSSPPFLRALLPFSSTRLPCARRCYFWPNLFRSEQLNAWTVADWWRWPEYSEKAHDWEREREATVVAR